MSFVHSNKFKTFKNFIIGIGASVVMIGALGKIQSYDWVPMLYSRTFNWKHLSSSS